MNLEPIKENQFPKWREMREEVYSSFDDEFHEKEMKQIFESSDWFCYFCEEEGFNLTALLKALSEQTAITCA